VIQKFLTQEETHANLVKMTSDATSRIENLAEERQKEKTAVDEMRFSGGSTAGSRKEVDEWERKLGDKGTDLERMKTRHGRVQKSFVDMRAGIEHLTDKLEAVRGCTPLPHSHVASPSFHSSTVSPSSHLAHPPSPLR
jgi:chromosome segregation ATPase